MFFLNKGFAHSLFFNEQYKQIFQVAHQKWANERIAIFFVNHSFAHFFAKNKWLALKTNERIPNPAATIQQPECEKFAEPSEVILNYVPPHCIYYFV